MDRMLNYRPKYLADIESHPCGHKYIYDRGDGRKTAYLHYVDGMETWELYPKYWDGWKLMLRVDAEGKEIW